MDARLSSVIGECLNAAANGPFFPDWEFSTLFGLERSEVANIAASWPQAAEPGSVTWLAINGAMGNLLSYPLDSPRRWSDYISVSRAEVEGYYGQWHSQEAA